MLPQTPNLDPPLFELNTDKTLEQTVYTHILAVLLFVPALELDFLFL